MASISVVTQPTEEPISLSEAKLHLKQDSDADDSLISSLIVSARQYCESYVGQQLVTATRRLKLDCFSGWRIELPYPPLQSVTSVVYLDTGGNSTTLSGSDYTVDIYSMPGFVEPAYSKVWPTTRGVSNSVTITYVAGYGAALAVPDAVKSAMKLLIGHWYENRESVNVGNTTTALEMSVDALLTSVWHGSRYLSGVDG